MLYKVTRNPNIGRLSHMFALLVVLLALTSCAKPPRPTVSLHDAARTGNCDQLRRHVYWGCNINENEGRDKNTPLHVAAEAGQVKAVEFLVEVKGIDINSRNAWGNTSLHSAVLGHSVQCVRVLLEHGADAHASNGKFTPIKFVDNNWAMSETTRKEMHEAFNKYK